MRVVRARLAPEQAFRTGKFCHLRPTTRIITSDTTVETGTGHASLVFVKRAVPMQLCSEVYPVVRGMATKSRARAQASGPLTDKTRNKVKSHPGLRQVNSYAYVQYHPNKYAKPGGFQYANSVDSGTVGWVGDNTITRYTADHFDDKYNVALRLASQVDAGFRKHVPGRHRAMAGSLKGRPKMSPAFTTMAANYNFRTAMHRDNKTMKGSMLVFTVLGDDKVRGGLLVFPQLDVAVDMRVGDMLAFDAELLHCNTAFQNKGFHRLSCVFYNHVP
ncbi:hypothetical protein WJX74_002141 [Apatococcus lobatus]|uniref:2OGFeDO JBP1/TET oxygenase domain-containing protein n=1 Tax=Apatococcus lobatus TaxID=904363 RepID=A0AAW1R0R7_9CHLO